LTALDVALQELAQAFGNVKTDVTGTYHDYTFHVFNSGLTQGFLCSERART
jgi:hypothetical protein